MLPLDVEVIQRDWQLLAAVRHADLVPFIREWFRERRSWLTTAHWCCTLAACAALIAVIVVTRPGARTVAVQLAVAVPLMLIAILPLHEGLHHLAYRLAGAPRVRWTIAWRRGIAYVVAHRFVATPGALTAVALAPFAALNIALGAAAVLWPTVSVLAATLLVLHTSACAGDLAMLNFLWHHRDREVVTFDDAEQDMTYFYSR